jgi:hypothetical protein
MATPLLGMDFPTKFGLPTIPAKQQVLYKASSRIFSKTSTTSFITPWSTETATSSLPFLSPLVSKKDGSWGGAPAATITVCVYAITVPDSMWLWGGGEVGGGVLNCVVDHIMQDFYTLFLTRFRTYKIDSPPQTKMTSKDDFWGLVSLKFLRPWFPN